MEPSEDDELPLVLEGGVGPDEWLSLPGDGGDGGGFGTEHPSLPMTPNETHKPQASGRLRKTTTTG